MNRHFVDGYMKFKDDPRIQEMNKKVMVYNQSLIYHGLRDHQVNKTALGKGSAFVLFVYRLLLLTVWVIIGFPG